MGRFLVLPLFLFTSFTFSPTNATAMEEFNFCQDLSEGFSTHQAKPFLFGIAENLLGGPKNEFIFWNEKEPCINQAPGMSKIHDYLDGKVNFIPTIPEEIVAVEYIENILYNSIKNTLSPQIIQSYLTNLLNKHCLYEENKLITLTQKNIYPDHFVEIARQAFESGLVIDDLMGQLKLLGALGHFGARTFYGTMVESNKNTTFYEKIFDLLMYTFKENKNTEKEIQMLRELTRGKKEFYIALENIKKMGNVYGGRDIVRPLTRLCKDYLFNHATEKECTPLWELVLHPLQGENVDYGAEHLNEIYHAINDGALHKDRPAAKILFEKLEKDFHFNTKGEETTLELLERLAQKFPSMVMTQCWASHLMLGVDNPKDMPQEIRAFLVKQRREHQEKKQIMQAKGIGNVLAFALRQHPHKTRIAVMQEMRNLLHITYTEADEGGEKTNFQRQLFILDQFFVHESMAKNSIERDLFNQLLQKDQTTKEMMEAFDEVSNWLEKEYLKMRKGTLNDLGFGEMTPQERYEELLKLTDCPLGVELYIDTHYGALAFNDGRNDIHTSLGLHFGQAHTSLQDINKATENTNEYTFVPHLKNLSILFELAISQNLRPAQERIMQHIVARMQNGATKEEFQNLYKGHLRMLNFAFTMLRSDPPVFMH